MENANVDIVTIGNIVKETIIFPEKIVGPVLGSPCAYTSLALAKMGKRVGMVSYCGDDWKRIVDKELRLVDTQGCMKYMHTTENHLIYRDEEHNRVEYYKAAPVINGEVIPQEYLKATHFFVCPMDFEVNVEVCQMLHDMNKIVVVDLGGYGGTTSYNHFPIDTNRGYKLINDLCKYSTIIKASEDDMKYIMPGMKVEECTEYLVARGPQYAVVTCGSRGAVYQESGKKAHPSPGFKTQAGKEKNLTGAGDAFAAGMITALTEQPDNIEYACAYGNSIASLVLEEKGGCSEERMPVDRMIKLRMEGKL